jgi:hypothetical protein
LLKLKVSRSGSHRHCSYPMKFTNTVHTPYPYSRSEHSFMQACSPRRRTACAPDEDSYPLEASQHNLDASRQPIRRNLIHHLPHSLSAKCRQPTAKESESRARLDRLPGEILRQVARQLENKDALNLATVCKSLQDASESVI